MGNYGIQTYLDVDASWATFSTGEHEQHEPGFPPMWKLIDDLDRYTLVIDSTQPEVIVEVGTKWGGSALWFSSYGVEVITVDIDPTFSAETRAKRPANVTFITGDSADPAVFAQVKELVGGRTCMVSLDGEHAAPHVEAEIKLYRELVTGGHYLVVEDGIFDLVDPSLAHLGGARIPAERGPLKAIVDTLFHDVRFSRDFDVEMMTPRTYHPAGWWSRWPDGGH